MSDFDYWFENIVSEADLISSPNALTKAWIQKDKDVTSAYDIDELLEQLLGDLRLHEHLRRFDQDLCRIGAVEAVAAFAQALLDLEKIIKSDLRLKKPENLLISSQWEGLVRLAKCITQLPAARIYTTPAPKNSPQK